MKHIRLFLLPLAALVLEAMPFGAVMIFGAPGENGAIEHIRRTACYFSLTPFGYANFGPLFTALFTCALLALAVWQCVRPSAGAYKVMLAVNALAVIASLLPLFWVRISIHSSARPFPPPSLPSCCICCTANERKIHER